MLVTILDIITGAFSFLDSLPTTAKVITFIVAAVTTIALAFFLAMHNELRLTTFSSYFQVTVFALLGINLHVLNGDEREFFAINVKPLSGEFVYGDPSTWCGGLKALLIVAVIALVLAIAQILFARIPKVRYKAMHKLLMLVYLVSLTITVYYLGYFILSGTIKAALIMIPLNLVMNIAVPLLLFGGWIAAFFLSFEHTGDGTPYTGESSSGSYPDDEDEDNHDENYGAVLRMPSTIKDEYGNVYTKFDTDIHGTYVTYTGPGGPVTIYAEDINMFSATGDGHHFHW